MASEPEPQKRTPLTWVLIIAGSVLLVIVAFSLLVSLSLSVNWPAWTGFADYTTPKSDALDYHPARTLWDWLDLLVVPVVLVLGGYLFSRAERNSNNSIAHRRIKEDRRIAKRRVLEDRKIAEDRIKEDRKIVEEQRSEDRRIEAERIAEEHRLQDDRIRDALLREYLDRMSDLLITHELGTSKEGDPKRLVARARTVTILIALGEDGARKGNILRFLYEAKLLNVDNPIVNLQDADLRHTDLTGANLIGANLIGAELSRANLIGADLSGADLSRANLLEAKLIDAYLLETNLSSANLIDAKLSGAKLTGANLSGANLSGANLIGANLIKAKLLGVYLIRADLRGVHLDNAVLSQAFLTNANLKGARVTREQLERVADLTGAILPDHIQLTSIEP